LYDKCADILAGTGGDMGLLGGPKKRKPQAASPPPSKTRLPPAPPGRLVNGYRGVASSAAPRSSAREHGPGPAQAGLPGRNRAAPPPTTPRA